MPLLLTPREQRPNITVIPIFKDINGVKVRGCIELTLLLAVGEVRLVTVFSPLRTPLFTRKIMVGEIVLRNCIIPSITPILLAVRLNPYVLEEEGGNSGRPMLDFWLSSRGAVVHRSIPVPQENSEKGSVPICLAVLCPTFQSLTIQACVRRACSFRKDIIGITRRGG